ncbi:MAG: helicase protein [Parcubacteria group bacterium GW2011_GWD2_42_14]|nr:MAG: helicase protein [Parcubacteria group bacterium GW2011_GWD2_42_14]
MFNLDQFKQSVQKESRFRRRIDYLQSNDRDTQYIEKAVDLAANNIKKGIRSFIVYGDPQSGKTEMMIALTAKLLDLGHKIIIVLLKDDVLLLSQNLNRFRRSNIDPAPKNFSEILSEDVTIGNNEWIIFSKKNSQDLKKLLTKLSQYKNKVIIDDEADYASPNGKINKNEKTKINEHISELLANEGIYIGVTATPARLDLNNTFENANNSWVSFDSHAAYTGQDVFFPVVLNQPLKFTLTLLPDKGDGPVYLREAIFRFLCNVAYLNHINVGGNERNFSMLIHTSGSTSDHSADLKILTKTVDVLKNIEDPNFEKYVKRIWEISKERYPGTENDLVTYILENIGRNTVVVMNSKTDKEQVDYTAATNPASPFTFAIGGNVVSRGVTFENATGYLYSACANVWFSKRVSKIF